MKHKKGFEEAFARLPESKQRLLQLVIDTKQWFDGEFKGKWSFREDDGGGWSISIDVENSYINVAWAVTQLYPNYEIMRRVESALFAGESE